MKEKISKETLENLLALSRIGLFEVERAEKEPKLLGDLQRILDHFEELKEVDTDGVDLIEGGKAGADGYREDEERSDFRREDATEQFPEAQKGYLKVPAVLEHKKIIQNANIPPAPKLRRAGKNQNDSLK